jgi:hypothetical protein
MTDTDAKRWLTAALDDPEVECPEAVAADVFRYALRAIEDREALVRFATADGQWFSALDAARRHMEGK